MTTSLTLPLTQVVKSTNHAATAMSLDAQIPERRRALSPLPITASEAVPAGVTAKFLSGLSQIEQVINCSLLRY
jgi:hypothetical protein